MVTNDRGSCADVLRGQQCDQRAADRDCRTRLSLEGMETETALDRTRVYDRPVRCRNDEAVNRCDDLHGRLVSAGRHLRRILLYQGLLCQPP